MRKVVMTLAGMVAATLLAWGVLHVIITPVNTEQIPPDGHFQSGCAWCHIVSGSADLIE